MAIYDARLLWILRCTLLSLITTIGASSNKDNNCYCDSQLVVVTTTVNPEHYLYWTDHKSCHNWTDIELLKSLAHTLQHANQYIKDAMKDDLEKLNHRSIVRPAELFRCLPMNTINLKREADEREIYKAVFVDLWKMSVLVSKLRSDSTPISTMSSDKRLVRSKFFKKLDFEDIDNCLRKAYCRYRQLVDEDFVRRNVLEPPIDWSECYWTCRNDITCLARELLVLSHLQFVSKSALEMIGNVLYK